MNGDIPPVGGDMARGVWFLDTGWGYDAPAVTELLGRIAAELDAGQPAGPLLENAKLPRKTTPPRYDIDAVDWFLAQILLHPAHDEQAGTTTDPWRDLPVAQFTQNAGCQPAGLSARQRRQLRRTFTGECQNAWREFGQISGTCLTWGRTGRLWPPGYCELRTADQQKLASRELRSGMLRRQVFRTGGKSFTRDREVLRGSSAGPGSSGIDELAARSWHDYAGHFAATTMDNREQEQHAHKVCKIREFADETGIPVLYSHEGQAVWRAYNCITFPNKRWFRLLIRGTELTNAIMTAVDHEGNRIARYRMNRGLVKIIVNPNQKLTDELALAIAVSAPWLASYFSAEPHSESVPFRGTAH